MKTTRILALAAAIIAAPGFAIAQTTTATGTAASQAGAQAGAGASSGASSAIQQTFTGPPQQRVIYDGGTTQTIQGGTNDRYRATIRNTPDAYAPAVTGGTNPCQNAASAGGAVAGFGLAIGGSWSDDECERRNLSALLHNQGQHALAQEVLCETATVRRARQRMGQPCIADRPPAPAPGVVLAAAPPASEPVAYVEHIGGGQIPPARRSPADWCGTVGRGDPVSARRACGWTGPNATVRPAS